MRHPRTGQSQNPDVAPPANRGVSNLQCQIKNPSTRQARQQVRYDHRFDRALLLDAAIRSQTGSSVVAVVTVAQVVWGSGPHSVGYDEVRPQVTVVRNHGCTGQECRSLGLQHVRGRSRRLACGH